MEIILNVGDKVGRLLIKEILKESAKKKSTILAFCICDCGSECVYPLRLLKKRDRTSCGCYFVKGGKHKNHKKAYSSWGGMKTRCFNPNAENYPRYGGAGVMVCKGFLNFNTFHEKIGNPISNKHTIDRIESNKHYSCGGCDECLINGWEMNVRWATYREQTLNSSVVHFITYNGETLCLKDWAKKLKMSRLTLSARINNYGWSIEDAFLKPVRKNKKK